MMNIFLPTHCPRCQTSHSLEIEQVVKPSLFWAYLIEYAECRICTHRFELGRNDVTEQYLRTTFADELVMA